MATARHRLITPQQYLRIERNAETKSEYFAGHMFAMAGASLAHNQIAANVLRHLGNRLDDKPCEALGSDMRIKVAPTGLYTYPDVVVLCEEPRFDDDVQDTVLNPVIIFEIISKSTEAYDRGDKFGHYLRLDSLTDYVLVRQDRPRIEHYARKGDQWILTVIEGIEAILDLGSINVSIPLKDMYHRIDFSKADPANGPPEVRMVNGKLYPPR